MGGFELWHCGYSQGREAFVSVAFVMANDLRHVMNMGCAVRRAVFSLQFLPFWFFFVYIA